MRQNDDAKTVAAMDLLVPRVCSNILISMYFLELQLCSSFSCTNKKKSYTNDKPTMDFCR
jgi:hypothetical protein